MRPDVSPTGHQRILGEKEIIVSKTDLTGKITYANNKFLTISGFQESELLGIQHNIIRHPQMPRVIFKFLWDQLNAKNEVFAYVLNLCKHGDHYWVLAHVTPSLNDAGVVTGYHSSRRAVDQSIVQSTIVPVYEQLSKAEKSTTSPKQGLESSYKTLLSFIQENGGNYDKWLFSL
ncbi:MAG: PAS domain S-box protein [Sneathiella sp.]|nr:PAS domain S-box protein [Sneathiella sp.]